MTRTERLRKHERSIAKAIFALSLITLIVLGSTVLVIRFLTGTPRTQPQTQGWRGTSEIRIVMDSSADWARIMFNDYYGTNDNGLRITKFDQRGWLLGGNETGYRIDAGLLTFIDVTYNSTVIKSGDIVGFFKGNNVFRHTRMYADVDLEVNTNMRQVFVFLILAGAGTTTFQFINKQTGILIWQDTDTGNSFTQYARRWIPSDAFFTTQHIEGVLIVLMVIGTIAMIVLLNLVPYWRKGKGPATRDSEGL